MIEQKRNPIHKSSGLTLIEVMVTVIITSIGLLGLLSLQMQAMKATQDAGNYSQSFWILNDLANRIKVNRNSSTSYIVNPVNCAVLPTACSNYNNGANTLTSNTCTGPQLAAWDLFEVACGAPRNSALVRGNPINDLPGIPGTANGPNLSVACVTAGCVDGDALQVTLTWRARIDNTEANERLRQATDNLLTQRKVVYP